MLRGRANLEIGNQKAAIEAFEKACELNPHNKEAMRSLGGDPREAVRAAVAVELAHNFTLLHDDVIDEDRTRRHRATAWTVFGIPDAVIAGDAMLALAQRLLAEDGIEVGGGLGPQAPAMWRVGLMGPNANRETADRVLGAITAALDSQRVAVAG